MSKIIRSIRYDVAEKITEGTEFDFTNNVLIVGPSGFDTAGDLATLFLGDIGHYVQMEFSQGIRLRTFNEITFETGGSNERMVITSSGNVGIGTDNPSQTLHIQGDSLIQGGDLFLVDTNEKIASNGTDMFFHVGGSEVVRFENGGNVGIGTDNPSQTLHVQGDSLIQGGDLFLVDTNEKIASDGTDMFFHVAGSEVARFNNTGTIDFVNNITIGTTISTTAITITQGAQNGYVLQTDNNGNASWADINSISSTSISDTDGNTNINTELNPDENIIRFTTAGTERMLIGSTGNIGIGTDNPSQTLHVQGDSLIQGGDLFLVDTNEKIASNGTDMFFHVGGSEVVRFESGGNVGIGTDNPSQTLHVQGDSLIQGGDLFLVDTNEKIASNGTDMFFHVGGSEVVRFENGGNVGIGTNNPSKKLDVYGSNSNMIIRSTGEDQDSFLYLSTPFDTSAVSKTAIIAEGITSFSRSNLHFCLNNTENNTIEVSLSDTKMTILPSGNVGIGTDNPSTKLDVRGILSVEETETVSGSGIQLKYTGIPFFQIVTNRPNTNLNMIVNGWGASSNTGFACGTIRTDGIAFQVVNNVAITNGLPSSDGTQLMVVAGNGNVGIGTNNPLAILNIAKGYQPSSSLTSHFRPQILISNKSGEATDLTGIAFANPHIDHTTLIASAIYYRNSIGGNYGMDGYLGIAVADSSTGGPDPYGLTEGDYESLTRLTINNSGNVGIGTNNATQRLDVRGNSLIQGISGFTTATQTAFLYIGDTNHYVQSEFSQGLKLRTDDELTFETGGSNERMVITSSGNVGIGTNAPATKLDVSTTTGAFLPPRLTTTQRDALTPIDGMVIFNSTIPALQCYYSSTWNSL